VLLLVWVSVTGQTVVDTAIVLVVTIVLRAGQSVTVAAHDVMVISVVEKTVEVEYEMTGAEVVKACEVVTGDTSTDPLVAVLLVSVAVDLYVVVTVETVV